MKLPKLTPALTLFIAFVSVFFIFTYYFFDAMLFEQKSVGTVSQIRSYTERVVPKQLSEKIDGQTKEVVLSGIVKVGGDVDKQYCSYGFYLQSLENSTDSILLRRGPDLDVVRLYYDITPNKEVSITGSIPLNRELCNDQSCDCDEFILVKNITEIN